MTLDYSKLNKLLKQAIKEDIYDGHIDQEELSPEILQLLQPIGELEEFELTIWSEAFQQLVARLQEEAGEEESEILKQLIEEIGATNYQMLMDDEINYITIHIKNDAEEDDIDIEANDQVEDEEVLEESLNEIAMERYLSVEPEGLVLYQGDKVEDRLDKFPYVDGMTDDDVRKAAKKCFSNITDDIKVQWF